VKPLLPLQKQSSFIPRVIFCSEILAIRRTNPAQLSLELFKLASLINSES
jgi:hypothetical protein